MTVKLKMCCMLVATVASAHVVLIASAQDTTNELANPGFEEGTEETLNDWQGYGRGYVVDYAVFHSGKRSIKCTVHSEQDRMGAMQVILFFVSWIKGRQNG